MKDRDNTIRGACHCGAVAYAFTPTCPVADVSVRGCACSFCTRHGARYASDPAGELVITIPDLSRVHCYGFGTGTASFLVCRCCGLVPAVLSRIGGRGGGRVYGVVNLATAISADFLHRPFSVMDFGTETVSERLARRQRNWIARVSVPAELAVAGSAD